MVLAKKSFSTVKVVAAQSREDGKPSSRVICVASENTGHVACGSSPFSFVVRCSNRHNNVYMLPSCMYLVENLYFAQVGTLDADQWLSFVLFIAGFFVSLCADAPYSAQPIVPECALLALINRR